jgi:hypothetical protein
VYRIFRVGGEQHECYVGSTTGRADRRYQHLWHLRNGSHHSPRLQAAWEKYGADLFRYEILEDVTDIGTLRLRERHWMTRLAAPGADLPRYNCSGEVDQPPHWTPSAQTRETWSRQRTGRRHSAKTKAAIAASSRGRRHTDETLAVMRKLAAGRRPNATARERSRQTCRTRFADRVAAARTWCLDRGIKGCVDGPSLVYAVAEALENKKLVLGDRLPSVGALAESLTLSLPTVSLSLRRRPPIVQSLTVRRSGKGLVIGRAARNAISRSASFYVGSTGDHISATHRERGVGPTAQCRLAARHPATAAKISATHRARGVRPTPQCRAAQQRAAAAKKIAAALRRRRQEVKRRRRRQR